MKNFERMAIKATIFNSNAPLENKNAMLVALRQEGGELATAKTERAALEARVKELETALKDIDDLIFSGLPTLARRRAQAALLKEKP